MSKPKQADVRMMVPGNYGISVAGEPEENFGEPTVVRLERSIQRQVSREPTIITIPETNTAADANPFGGARRLMSSVEAPEMFGMAKQMASHYTRMEEERKQLDVQIQLLIERRVRTDTNMSLMRAALTNYARSLDIDSILPASLHE